MNGLTVAVLTRKREKLLRRCLESMARQTIPAGEVIVIDNDSKETARKIVEDFKKKLPVRYVVEPRKGIAYARNTALSLTRSRYLGFVDDDCVLSNNWNKEGLRVMRASKQAYVVGKTELMNPDSLTARARFFHSQKWFLSKLDLRTNQVDPQSLDTKNVIFDFEIIKKYKLKFDNRFNKVSVGGGEDSDMGLQLNKLKFAGLYVQKMRLQHCESEKLSALVKKAYWSGRAYFLLSKKWKLENQVMNDFRIKWKTWFDDFWVIPHTNQKLRVRKGYKVLMIHLLIKIYDRAWIKGYLAQKNDRL